MSAFAIFLILSSAVIHVVWNFMGKRRQTSTAFFFIASVTAVPPSIYWLWHYRSWIGAVPWPVWLMVFFTGCFEAIYYFGLAASYRHGHFSVVYPLMRALPILMVAVTSLLIGRGKEISDLALCGMALVAAGCVVQPLKRFRDFRFSNYLTPSCLFSLLAASGTTGYTLVDDESLRKLRATFGGDVLDTTLFYLALLSLSALVMTGIIVACNRAERREFATLCRRGWGNALFAGALIMLSYGLVLAAMAYVSDVSYVNALRQINIPLAAIVGIFFLKENAPRPLIVGVTLITFGLIITALG